MKKKEDKTRNERALPASLDTSQMDDRTEALVDFLFDPDSDTTEVLKFKKHTS